MIYQLYFHPEQVDQLLAYDPYRPFGLEPCVNRTICLNCPELRCGVIRSSLCEYAAMLHLWRNPPQDGDDWIGFTSWRQGRKGVRPYGRNEIEAALRDAEIVSWGYHDPGPPDDGRVTTGILRILAELGLPYPSQWLACGHGIFANYWAMRQADFEDFMKWSYPMCAWAIEQFGVEDFLRERGVGSEPFVGELLERAVQLWQLFSNRRVRYVGSLDLSKMNGEPRGHWYTGPDDYM